jgi:hypothetical protein
MLKLSNVEKREDSETASYFYLLPSIFSYNLIRQNCLIPGYTIVLVY